MVRSSESFERAMKAGCKANCGVQAGNPHLSYTIVTGKTAAKKAPNAGTASPPPFRRGRG